MPSDHPSSSFAGKHFVINVLWSWLGVVIGLASGLLLSPYVIRHLGAERYGIWALVFSLTDYFALMDFGFRSAVVKFVAHYRASGELEQMDEMINTGLVYLAIAATVVTAASLVVAHNVTSLFRTSTQDESAFRFLTVTVGVGFALGLVFNTCSAVLEAHQRFDITSRILILNNAIRIVGCFAAVYMGMGLKAMGVCVLAGQSVGYFATYRATRELLPGKRFSPGKANFACLRRMWRYGSNTVAANTSLMVLNQDAPVLIGYFLNPTMVGYYSFPSRLLNYSVDLVNRVGMVTGVKTAELAAHGDTEAIKRLTILVNRYCLTLFLPVSMYLVIFGRQLLEVWINPQFAVNCAPLIPTLAAGVVIAIAAQFNATSVLYGLAKHSALAKAVMLEAALSVAGLWYAIPRYGIVGAACVVSGLMILFRGVLVPCAVSHYVGLPLTKYLAGIYGKPLTIGIPVSAAAWVLNEAMGRAATWPAVVAGGLALSASYYGLVFLLGLQPEHRGMITGWLAARRKTAQAQFVRVAGQSH